MEIKVAFKDKEKKMKRNFDSCEDFGFWAANNWGEIEIIDVVIEEDQLTRIVDCEGEIKVEALKVVSLIRKYEKCPYCGNDKVGNGEGGLIVEEDTFKRTCKCGFQITINEDGKEINS